MINLSKEEFVKSFNKHNKSGAGYSRKYVIEAYKIWSRQKSLTLVKVQHQVRCSNLAWLKKQKSAFNKSEVMA
jgi:hypothetical protein